MEMIQEEVVDPVLLHYPSVYQVHISQLHAFHVVALTCTVSQFTAVQLTRSIIRYFYKPHENMEVMRYAFVTLIDNATSQWEHLLFESS